MVFLLLLDNSTTGLPSPLRGYILQVLDHLWIRVLKRGMKLPRGPVGYYKCVSRRKRDKKQTFPWILRMARSTIEIVQPSLSWETGQDRGRAVRRVSRSALVKALRHTTVGNCPSPEAVSGAAA